MSGEFADAYADGLRERILELEGLLREAVVHVPFEPITSSLQEQYGMDRSKWPLRDRINVALVLGKDAAR